MPRVRDAMTSPVHTVSADDPLVTAAAVFVLRGWSGAPVVDAVGRLVGVLSERDVVRALADASFHQSPGEILVGQAMTVPAWHVPPDLDLYQLIPQLIDGPHRRVIVCENRFPVGIVTRRDLVRVLVEASEDPRRTATYDTWAAHHGSHNPFTKPRNTDNN